ncbi:39S ribosomal protein L54, mitochondrial [Aplysia californica]|uniref:Large ribosomal subunit protein mL54 n=1 Tax=Aplysia californica TaxID=6500 RepID=A0ABM0JHZ7_APLCA|nr:39S ribosomal protein L54, mitochondrial [Aplysia californica]
MAASFRSLALRGLSNNMTFSKFTVARTYAKKVVGKVGAPGAQKARLEVENDPEKLLNYCCGANIYAEGTDPEIKPNSEYPDWLWNLRTEPGGVDLSELDNNSKYYWRRLQRLTAVRNRRIGKRLQKLNDIQFPESK